MNELVEINFQELKTETLDAVIESFVLREGTDYGSHEISLESKLKAVRKQLDNGKAKLVFDPESESCAILLERDFQKLQACGSSESYLRCNWGLVHSTAD